MPTNPFLKLESLAKTQLSKMDFSALAFGVIDFRGGTFHTSNLSKEGERDFLNPPSFPIYFDLASLTKPLALWPVYAQKKKEFTKDLLLLLNHRGGLPSGGRLPQKGWREQILSYPIHESPDLYSDYSYLRLMLEVEKRFSFTLKNYSKDYWDQEVVFWKELPPQSYCPPTGLRNGKVIRGEVHDDNCYVINEFCSHAGLFGTVEGVCRTLLRFDRELGLNASLENEFNDLATHHRFVAGWDRVTDQEKTLAGHLASPKTFGHLGFTGTSIWIDLERKRGAVLLTNATQNYWYHRDGLNQLRRNLGNEIWSL